MPITVSALNIYPLKSTGGIAVPVMDITTTGPAGDREWMVVHHSGPKAGNFITQRDKGCEKLAEIRTRLHSNGMITVSAPGMPDLHPSDFDLPAKTCDVKIWGEQHKAIDGGNYASQWITAYLGIPALLVNFPIGYIRACDQTYAKPSDQVGFADGFPILITSQASLDTLNAHLPFVSQARMDRFRPNIVIDGLKPFEEDTIHEVKIGDDVIIELVKPCARCKITTIDQTTGQITSKDPLATLARLRRGSSPDLNGTFFGQNAAIRNLGQIRTGDEVQILSRKTPHPALAGVVLKMG